MGIAENILGTRTAKGLTQEQLAEVVGVSRQTIAKWESGETAPDLEHAAALAEALGTSLDGLVNFEGNGLVMGAPPRGKYLFGNVTVDEDGRIALPQEAREVFGINPGDELVVLGEEGQGLALSKTSDFLAGVAAVMAAVQRAAK